MQINYTWLPADKPDISDTNVYVAKAHQSFLTTTDGKQIYDAISSWWCKPLGHQHQLVRESILKQLDCFEHHIPANALNNTIETLSNRLTKIFTQMDKVMYACDGSSAVEIAMKLSYETRVLQKQSQRSKFIALSGGYHGETVFTLSVCGIPEYKKNYEALISTNYFIDNITYVTGTNDPLWSDCNFDNIYWDSFFINYAPTSTALIIEPIVQGTAGMKIISRDFLIKIINLAKTYDLHIIADEIMVGLGRLGCYSVSKEILGIEPDLVCFAKNLTAGAIPMSTVVINRTISDCFREHQKIFPHSHTHSCNALAAAVAVNYINYLDTTSVLNDVKLAESEIFKILNNLKAKFSFIKKISVIASIGTIELDLSKNILDQVFTIGIEELIYIRPIGNSLYIMPPLYNILEDLEVIATRVNNTLDRISGLLVTSA